MQEKSEKFFIGIYIFVYQQLICYINPLYHDCNLLKRQLKHHVALRLLYLCIVITEKQVLQTDEQTKPKNKFINRLN
jgi:hypothetical protein